MVSIFIFDGVTVKTENTQSALRSNICLIKSALFFQGFSVQITYTLYSLSVFLLARSLQVILEICATYRLVSHLLADW